MFLLDMSRRMLVQLHSRMIKAVIFDVDGVLIDSFAANAKFFQNLAIFTGYTPFTTEQYRELFHRTMLDVIALFAVGASESRIKEIWEIGRTQRNKLYPSDLLEYPEKLEETIQELYNNYQIGIVTSRVRGSVFSFPRLKNIENFFSTVVYFEDTNKHKPSPEPLLLCAKRMNTKPSEMVYVGDAASDIQSARAAGMKIIEYSPNNDTKADVITYNFAKLPVIIKNLV